MHYFLQHESLSPQPATLIAVPSSLRLISALGERLQSYHEAAVGVIDAPIRVHPI